MTPSSLAAAGPGSAIADVQSRIAQVQSRIAALSGRVPAVATAGTTASSGTTTPASTMFSGELALAQAQLAASGSSATTPAGTGQALVDSAEQHLGVPYRWGGTDPATGLDCSGLVQLAARENGITLPRTAAEQARSGTEVASLAQAQPGDLVVLSGGSHIGIYVGDGKMVHAPKAGDVVKVSEVWETPMTIRRITGGATGTADASSVASLLRSSVLGGSLLGGSTSSASALAGAGAPGPLGAVRAPAGAVSGASAYQPLFDAATARYGLPAGLLSAVASVESGYDAGATSPAGAQGLMQIMPGTARELGVDATDPVQAVDGAARLLSQHLSTFGSQELALAAYNAGPGNVRKHGGVPPFAETQSYVRKVAAAQARSL